MPAIFDFLRRLFIRREKYVYMHTLPGGEQIRSDDYERRMNEVRALYDSSDMLMDERFYHQLRATVAWTNSILAGITDFSSVDNARVLRTVNPQYECRPFYTYDVDDWPESNAGDYFDYKWVMKDVLPMREVLPLTSSRGRMLMFQIDITTRDGAPVLHSEGFVDVNDIPPIDTWFFVTREYLYCWIPEPFVEVMQNAIDVEILDSYHWLDEEMNGFAQYLIRRLEADVVGNQ